MSSYRGMRTDSPWPLPVPAVSVSVGTRPGRPVSPSGSVGDTMRAQRGGAPIVPAVSGGASLSLGRQLPAASTKSGPPPVSRPAPASGTQAGATATAPADAPPAPIHSGQPAPPVAPASPTGRGGDRQHHRSRWEAH